MDPFNGIQTQSGLLPGFPMTVITMAMKESLNVAQIIDLLRFLANGGTKQQENQRSREPNRPHGQCQGRLRSSQEVPMRPFLVYVLPSRHFPHYTTVGFHPFYYRSLTLPFDNGSSSSQILDFQIFELHTHSLVVELQSDESP